MKICAMVWHLKGSHIDDFRFDTDGKKAGHDLDRRLGPLDEARLNKYLVQIDGGISPDSLTDINVVDQEISAFGIGFFVIEDSTLEIAFR